MFPFSPSTIRRPALASLKQARRLFTTQPHRNVFLRTHTPINKSITRHNHVIKRTNLPLLAPSSRHFSSKLPVHIPEKERKKLYKIVGSGLVGLAAVFLGSRVLFVVAGTGIRGGMALGEAGFLGLGGLAVLVYFEIIPMSVLYVSGGAAFFGFPALLMLEDFNENERRKLVWAGQELLRENWLDEGLLGQVRVVGKPTYKVDSWLGSITQGSLHEAMEMSMECVKPTPSHIAVQGSNTKVYVSASRDFPWQAWTINSINTADVYKHDADVVMPVEG